MTGPDGSADPDALRRYLAADPDARARLARMAVDLDRAVNVAASAAIRACAVAPRR